MAQSLSVFFLGYPVCTSTVLIMRISDFSISMVMESINSCHFSYVMSSYVIFLVRPYLVTGWYSLNLRTFALIVSTHPYCAREPHARSCIELAR